MNTDLNYTIYEACKKVEDELKDSYDNHLSTAKTFLISYLIKTQNIKTYVEINSDKGRHLFSVGYSVFKNGGNTYSINSYIYENDSSVERTYNDVLKYKNDCAYGESINIIRKPLDLSLNHLRSKNVLPDMVYINCLNAINLNEKDFDSFYTLMNEGSFFVFDNKQEGNTSAFYEKAKQYCHLVFQTDTLCILLKDEHSTSTKIKTEKLNKKLDAILDRVVLKNSKTNNTPLITIGVLTYNHKPYIEACLDSVLEQYGNFKLNIIICDDHSTDGTIETIDNFIAALPSCENITISFHKNKTNIGIIPNLNKLINLIKDSNCDYFSFCEGDDYYSTSNRLAKHLEFCEKNPQFASSYNKLMLYWQNEQKYEIHDLGYNDILPTEELAKLNYIGNFSATFFNGHVLKYVNDSLFEDKFSVDWMFNIFCSQFGDIGIINMPYTVYRKHEKGVWSGESFAAQCKFLIKEIHKYNKYLNFTYDAEFQEYCDRCYKDLANMGLCFPEQISVAVIDDFFPHPHSGFRYQEFNSILQTIPNSVVYSDGSALYGDAKKSQQRFFNEVVIDYKRNHPELSDRILKLDPKIPIKANLLYCNFLKTADTKLLDLAEKNKIPFVFTLYPGGAFALNSKESDEKLKKIFSSPWFHKVIVTQDITHQYLIEKGFCSEDQIEDIFGVVMPLEKIDLPVFNKKHFKIDKETLDVCFVAHKYTPTGKDKGYDVFIDVAKRLSEKYNFVNFHVVGPWSKDILDITGINNIRFYGSQGQDWFDAFYQDKDIILSPNINGQIVPGSFDGFPTGCLTDAALRDVAMFATDALSLNNGRFVDNKDIVIIEHDTNDIIRKIEYYIKNPDQLKEICINGHNKIKQLYCYNAQLKPRLQLLYDATQNESIHNVTKKVKPTNVQEYKEPLIKVIYRECVPSIFQRLFRAIKKTPGFLYREFVPNIIQRIYRKFKIIIKKILGR